MGINEADHWGSQSVNAYSIKTVKSSGAWDEYRIDISEILSKWDDETSENLYISLDSKWFGATAVDKSVFDSTQKQMIIGEKLYVDSIYLEGEEEIIPEPDPEPEPEPEVDVAPEFGKTLALFRTGADVMDRGYPTVEGVLTRATTDTTVAYTGKKSSLAWTFNADNGILIKMPYADALANAGTFNIRYYTPTANQKVMVLINEQDTFKSSEDNGSWSSKITTGEGWQTLSVDLASLRAKWASEAPEYLYVYLVNGWGATVGTKEEFEAGTKDAISGEKMYIDSMWIEDSTQAKTVVADFNTGAIVKDLKQNKLTTAQTDISVGYGSASSSLAWTIGDNGGIVIKYNANQRYCTDAVSSALVKTICNKANVPYQAYANRSDIAGGSTLGNIANTHLSVITADIGLAQLAMHSAFETAGKEDTEYMYKLLLEFFSSSLTDYPENSYTINY